MGQRPVPMMTPAPGERLQRFVGDRVRFVLKNGGGTLKGWSARLRTNLGRADVLRREIIQAHAKGVPPVGNAWRDLPMEPEGDQWSLELPLPEAGYFKAKAYLRDPSGWQHWPDGPDVGISVHPDVYRTANTIYCAFPRLFGPTRSAINAQNEKLESQIKQIEHHGYSILPPSGKLRDVIQHLPHIIETLGCRILHLLPVNPTPATYARFGRFGSPYAALDLTLIDPALVVFDGRTTGIDQFRELTYATHFHGGRVLLDIIINHTGWGSVLQENHPEWFLRNPDGTFASPGAWGVVWEDLVELKHDNVALWDQLAEMLLVWCHRGVDGFRCDAGYKVPVPAWQYIIARVQQEFPEALFLLEGLGGAWETTEALLTEGGMQWAYSELFQNYSGRQIADYLDYALGQSERVGLYVHYSETHDNDRLAKRGRAWSLLRNRLCALASVSSGFGFTCGVEWLATEKIDVHTSTGLAWGNNENIVPELATLNRLLATHPCFFDGARVTRLSAPDSPVCVLLRVSAEGKDAALVLVNTDVEREQPVKLPATKTREAIGSFALPDFRFELLGQSAPALKAAKSGEITFTLPPGAAYCLSPTNQPLGLNGDDYRRMRARAAWATQAVTENLSVAETGPCEWQFLSQAVDRSPFAFLAAVQRLDPAAARTNLQRALEEAAGCAALPKVVRWQRLDHRRITPVPPGHWLLIEDTVPFRASLELSDGSPSSHVHSIVAANGHVACFPPRATASDAKLELERYAAEDQRAEGQLRFLAPLPEDQKSKIKNQKSDDVILLTNGIGGMARILADLGRVKSKYDCVLAANLHPSVPVDRHVLVKRLRAWVNADGFISALDINNLVSLKPGPRAVWDFVANAGDGRTVEIQIQVEMPEGRNTTVFHFRRPTVSQAAGTPLPPTAEVRVTVRVDIEDRSFHWETRRNSGAEYHFSTNTRTLEGQPGFAFTPASDRRLRVFASAGHYYPQAEWSENIPHPIEQSRGQTGSGDAYSPGWFDLPLPRGANVTLILTADPADPNNREAGDLKLVEENGNDFEGRLVKAARAFVVRRDTGRTVIAGYPWFLDWGRDTFICARGLLAAGLVDEVKQILVTFARFEKSGTLPNTIYGNDASNRDTSDAPLWFAVVCEEIADCGLRIADSGKGGAHRDEGFYNTRVDESGRTIRNVLRSIATNYSSGTPNGIRMDRDSALIWSPAHFTWMDTNYPAATAREGYPIEIQALWIRLLRQLSRIDEVSARKNWSDLAGAALDSVEKRFWLEERGYYADLLIATSGQSAAQGVASDALRSNCIFPISLGLVKGERARRCVEAAARYLIVPGALRSLAPLPVTVPLPVYGNDGRLLNDPNNPYWGRYEGDEDTRRKSAYHNGTAWTWTFPVFCEALALAWDHSPDAVAAARAYLGSIDRLLAEGCLNQLPEILDGDAPHTQRGCDAQAWGVTEALRVWKRLGALEP